MRERTILRSNKTLWLGLIVLSFTLGCSKEDDKEEQWIDAVVLDLGSPAVDGCGFVLDINNQIYHPTNLEEQHQVDKKTVRIQYVVLDEMHTCGFPHSEVKYQKINIRKIMD